MTPCLARRPDSRQINQPLNLEEDENLMKQLGHWLIE